MLDERTIKSTKEKIKFLSESQNSVFDETCGSLKLNKVGCEWLFDYLYNDTICSTFDEYLSKYKMEYDWMIEKE